jgi:hypothetical protein
MSARNGSKVIEATIDEDSRAIAWSICGEKYELSEDAREWTKTLTFKCK